MLGLESVVVSSAGGEGETRIGLVDTDAAERLRTELRPSAPATGDPRAAADATRPEVTAPIELARMSAADLPRVIGVEVGRIALLAVLGILALAVGAGIGSRSTRVRIPRRGPPVGVRRVRAGPGDV